MWKRMLSLLSKCTPSGQGQVHSRQTCFRHHRCRCRCWPQSSEDDLDGQLDGWPETSELRLIGGSAEDAVLHTNVERTICRPQDHDSMLQVTQEDAKDSKTLWRLCILDQYILFYSPSIFMVRPKRDYFFLSSILSPFKQFRCQRQWLFIASLPLLKGRKFLKAPFSTFHSSYHSAQHSYL